jgi:hypothetical protein
MRKLNVLAFGASCLLLIATPAWAAQVKAVAGKKVQVDLQGATFKTGDILKVENSSGKTVGLIKVTKLSDTTADGVFKGKIEKGQTVKLRPPKAKTAQRSSSGPSSAKPGTSIYGAMLGYNMASADVKLEISGETVALSGTGFSFKAFMDYPLLPWLGFRGLAGVEQFNVGGKNNAADCNGECTAEINYLALDLWGRATVTESNAMKLWAGVGFDLMFPMTKDATALDEDSITNTSLFGFGGGLDWKLEAGSFLALQLEYNLYPSSEDVKASSIALRGGYAKSF